MKQYIENTGKEARFIAGKLLQPGEGREIDVPDPVKGDGTDAGEGDEHAPSVLLAKLLEGSIKTVTPQLKGLSAEQLAELDALEAAGQKRSGIAQAIAAELMARAADKLRLERQDALSLAELDLAAAEGALKALADDAPEAQRLDAQEAVERAKANVNGARAALEG